VVPAFDRLEEWARGKGVATGDRKALLEDPQVHRLMESEVLGTVSDLPRYEQPKKVGLLAGEFTIESGELTPSQKVRRRIVERNYADFIDALYAPEAVDQAVFSA
jgi:long-chain acyl-CoA synthetase